MFTLMRQSNLKKCLTVEAPPLLVSMVTAEMLFKFHSFTLECLAFLATWFVLSYLISLVSLRATER
jgi:hypothetical protein